MRRIRTAAVAPVVVATAAMGITLASPAAATGAASPAATKMVSYRGYQMRVPASWPVYRLAADPSRCVLFNRHAVYLGSPGADERCPARAFGRTEALLVQPLRPPTGQPTGQPPGAAIQHVLEVSLPKAGVQVTATYGRDQALIRSILAGAQVTPYASATAARRTSADGTDVSTGGSRATVRQKNLENNSHAPARPDGAKPATDRAATLSGEQGSGLGFDACTAPSAATMTDWLASPFRVAGTYLGGVNWACTYGNFTSSWVSQVAAEGWRFMPLWVGPQAPCSTIPGAVLINPLNAKAEGKAEAATAVTTAAGFGYDAGTPIYYDMEGYDSSNTACKRGVLNFLDGWTQGLHAASYSSGVYSSAASGIANLASKYGKPTYHSPDDIWIADWTGDPVLTDPYVRNSDWPNHQRLHQYYGGHLETWGGASVDIDSDVADGAVAGLSTAPQPPTATVTDQPDAVAVAPGSAATIRLAIDPGSAGAPVQWNVSAPSGLSVQPDSGTASASAVVRLTVTASSSATAGRYDLPVTATSGGQSLADTFELVSVAPAGVTLPTAQPIVLYAANKADMAVAARIAQRLALPTTDLTGTFTNAWTDLTGGKDVLLAVGQAALNGLFTNPCGWSNPAGTGAGSTPFVYAGEPLRQPVGVDFFENSAGGKPAAAAAVTALLTHYALTGALPNEGVIPTGPSAPTKACLGSPTVPVP